MSYNVEATWWGGKNTSWREHSVVVDGEVFTPRNNNGGSRFLYVNAEETLLVKLEHRKGIRQFAIEAQVWQGISTEDRQFFSPIIAAGDSGDAGWVLTHFFPGLTEAYEATYEQMEQADALAAKYDINDWDLRQWKVRPCGRILIHDFGISVKRSSNTPLPECLELA